ncbi:MAG: hypothetical protein N3D82_03510 [Ignisphaera sp.]|nr:hypothetical protein [Ignisphaera sp.]MCX8168075.1 hypothetical protein [Ignisphaera sp.]MDW8085899.1 hypothetical protein [Ignisphaera sp.]
MDECREYVKPIDIEGYAMAGKVLSISSMMCNRNRERIIVKLDDGENLCTYCLDEDEAKLCKKIIELYRNVRIVLDDDRYYHVARIGNEEDTRR